MEVSKLSTSLQSQLRSDFVAHNVSNCVIELVENALDAGALCIAVRLNFKQFRIEVIDNGVGLTKEQLEQIGKRYWTSKSRNKNFGYRGEALASIKNVSSKLMIISKPERKSTFCKIFEGSVAKVMNSLHERKCKGTTVIVENVLSNISVRQRCIKPSTELQLIKNFMQATALMFPKVNFILRDDTNDLKKVELLNIKRTNSTTTTFMTLFPNAVKKNFSMVKLVAECGKVTAKSMISKEICNTNRLQFVFVNKQYVPKSEITNYFNKLLGKTFYFKNSSTEKNTCKPIYVLNIYCSRDDYEITSQPEQRHIQFKNWERIKNCILKIVNMFDEQEFTENRKNEEKTSEKIFLPQLAFDKLNNAHTVFGLPAKRQVKQIKTIEGSDSSGNNDVINSTIEKDLIGTFHDIPHKSQLNHDNNVFGQKFEVDEKKTEIAVITNEKKFDDFAWIWKLRQSNAERQKSKNKQIDDKKTVKEFSKNSMECVRNVGNLSNYRLSKKKRSMRISNKLGCNFNFDECRIDNLISKYGTMRKNYKPAKLSIEKNVKENKPIFDSKESNLIVEKNEFHEIENDKLIPTLPFHHDTEEEMLSLSQQSNRNISFNNSLESKNKIETYNIRAIDYKDKVSQWISKLPESQISKQLSKEDENSVNEIAEDFKTKTILSQNLNNEYQGKRKLTFKLFENIREKSNSKIFRVKNPSRRTALRSRFSNTPFRWTLKSSENDADCKNENNHEENEVLNKNSENNNFEKNLVSLNLTNCDKNDKFIDEDTILFDHNPGEGTLKMNNAFNEIQNAMNLSQKSEDCPIDCQCKCHRRSKYLHNALELECTQTNADKNSEDTYIATLEYNSPLIDTVVIPREDEIDRNEVSDTKQPKSFMIDTESLFNKEDEINVTDTLDVIGKEEVVANNSDTDSKYFKKNIDIADRLKFKLKSKFLESCSTNDIPKGMLEMPSKHSRPDKLSEEERKGLLKLVKPYSMQNHITLDDHGNSCIRIFPFLKKSCEIFDNAKRDKELEELNCAIKFAKADISSFEFIAQIDNKFILARIVMQNSGDEVLVLFDQHAVNERIRVEQLLKDYTEGKEWLGTVVNPPIQLDVPQTYLSMFTDFQSNFEEYGLDYEVKIVSKEKLVISFVKVPTCFYNRATREKYELRSCLKQLVESLVKEMLQKFCAEGTLMHTLPNELLNVVNYEACRGAVKFGDKLTPQICATLIENLSTCDLPFQCAHGRPCLAPLVNLGKLKHLESKIWKPNMFNFEAVLCE